MTTAVKKTISLPPDLAREAEEVAQALGFAPSQMGKTLIFEAHDPKTGANEYVLVMLSANKTAISLQPGTWVMCR